jgi:hypothetical protein
LVVATVLIMAGTALGTFFTLKSATDYWLPVRLVDATDGYTAETEKKYTDTTITYCNISDGNATSAYTDAAVDFNEIGDGTGEYRLRIGAGEFATAEKTYLLKIVVAGCRTVCYWVHTTDGDPLVLEGATAVASIADMNDAIRTLLPADFNTVTVTAGNLHAHLKAADDNVVVDPNTTDIFRTPITGNDTVAWSPAWILKRLMAKRWW